MQSLKSMSDREILFSHLKKIGPASLSKFINLSVLKQLESIDQEINISLMIDILFTEKGFNCLKDKKLRTLILDTVNIQEDISSLASFSWGDNQKTKKFLDVLTISHDVIDSKEINSEKNTSEIFRPLFPYQNIMRKNILAFLSGNKNKTLVHMPTGAGKTRTMLESACDFMRTINDKSYVVVWLAHTQELCDQAVDEFLNLWNKHGDRDTDIIRLWGGRNYNINSITKPTFIVASFDTAYSYTKTMDDEKFKFFANLRQHCKLLIVDEAHQSIAPTYRQAIDLFSNFNTKVVGLTATPGRHHIGGDTDETVKLAEFYEDNKINITDDEGNTISDPIKFLTDKKVLSDATFYSLHASKEDIELSAKEIEYMREKLDIPKEVLTRLGEDSIRTQNIIAYIVDLVRDYSAPTIVFAPSKDNAITIATILKLHRIKAEAVVGDTSNDIRNKAIKDFKKGDIDVLVNFGVLTTGFDAPNIKAVVIARPTMSVVLYSQMIGRGLRGTLMGGEPDCMIVNVKDNLINMPNKNEAFLFFEQFYQER